MTRDESPETLISPEQRTAMTGLAKRQLRTRLRGVRSAIPARAHQQRCEQLLERLLGLPELAQPTGVASFWPIVKRKEVDLRGLDAELRRRSIPVYYPFMRAEADGAFATGFAAVDDPRELEERGRGFAEPPPEAPPAPREAIDVILVPALALAPGGERLGYGMGYYDATIGDHRPPATAIGVIFDFQLLPEVPTTDQDQAVDVVVTESRVLRVADGG